MFNKGDARSEAGMTNAFKKTERFCERSAKFFVKPS
jgi:hypothetical protein